ncbi:recombinase family protein, partial [Hydrogenivirga sp. 128-5-R1-1]|uniref:recombinase family protein n=1 Tax=Hydrogenivirga sp. 128-5-R1-1 TaxID=392423 RepID=UPI00015F029C
MKKAVIYARVSTDQATQKETPISSQISECFKYAENKGFTVVQVFTDEGISGTTDKRPAFQQMINYVQNNDIKAIITFDTSRLFRNIRHKMNYKELFDKLGVEIHYASNPFLSGNPNNDEERLARFWAEGGAMLFDAWYPIFCSVHIKRGNRENARQGFSTGRPLPIGYKTIKVKYGNTIKSKIIKAEEEAHIYFRILSLFEQGYGSKEIAKRLNEEGITNRGKQWKYQSILKILKNELYIGLVYGGG